MKDTAGERSSGFGQKTSQSQREGKVASRPAGVTMIDLSLRMAGKTKLIESMTSAIMTGHLMHVHSDHAICASHHHRLHRVMRAQNMTPMR